MPDTELLKFLEDQLTERRRDLFIKVLSQRTRHFSVVIENIYQSHNSSAVVRSCECFGIQDVHVIEKGHPFKTNTGIVMGADKWVDIHSYKEPGPCIDHLKNMGYRIIATTLHKENSILEDYNISQKTAFCFGEESVGLSKEITDKADGFLKIPMVGFTESFNISVTVALVLHYLTLKLRKSEDILWKLTDEEMIEKRIDWAVRSITKGDELVKHFYNRQQSG